MDKTECLFFTFCNFSPSEEVKVVIKPWIHVDGSLNRRVLDRMMGAILSYCIKHPGVMLNKIQNRFIPALQPFHTRELVEVSTKLKIYYQKKNNINLFLENKYHLKNV